MAPATVKPAAAVPRDPRLAQRLARGGSVSAAPPVATAAPMGQMAATSTGHAGVQHPAPPHAAVHTAHPQQPPLPPMVAGHGGVTMMQAAGAHGAPAPNPATAALQWHWGTAGPTAPAQLVHAAHINAPPYTSGSEIRHGWNPHDLSYQGMHPISAQVHGMYSSTPGMPTAQAAAPVATAHSVPHLRAGGPAQHISAGARPPPHSSVPQASTRLGATTSNAARTTSDPPAASADAGPSVPDGQKAQRSKQQASAKVPWLKLGKTNAPAQHSTAQQPSSTTLGAASAAPANRAQQEHSAAHGTSQELPSERSLQPAAASKARKAWALPKSKPGSMPAVRNSKRQRSDGLIAEGMAKLPSLSAVLGRESSIPPRKAADAPRPSVAANDEPAPAATGAPQATAAAAASVPPHASTSATPTSHPSPQAVEPAHALFGAMQRDERTPALQQRTQGRMHDALMVELGLHTPESSRAHTPSDKTVFASDGARSPAVQPIVATNSTVSAATSAKASAKGVPAPGEGTAAATLTPSHAPAELDWGTDDQLPAAHAEPPQAAVHSMADTAGPRRVVGEAVPGPGSGAAGMHGEDQANGSLEAVERSTAHSTAGVSTPAVKRRRATDAETLQQDSAAKTLCVGEGDGQVTLAGDPEGGSQREGQSAVESGMLHEEGDSGGLDGGGAGMRLAVRACAGGWGPMWLLAVRRLAALHASGGCAEAASCSEESLQEMREGVAFVAAAADDALAAVRADEVAAVQVKRELEDGAEAAPVLLPIQKMEMVPWHEHGDVGDEPGLREEMVLCMLRGVEADTVDALRVYLERCEQELRQSIDGISREHAVRALCCVSCMLRAYTIADAAAAPDAPSCGAVAFARLLLAAAASPDVAMLSTPMDVAILEEMQQASGRERLADGTTAALCAARCGYTGQLLLPSAGVVAAAMLLLGLHRDLCCEVWTAAAVAVLGLPAPLEDALSGAESLCGCVRLRAEAADAPEFPQGTAVVLRERPGARGLLLDILMHACSDANTGLAVRPNDALAIKATQRVAGPALSHVVLAQRVLSRVALRMLQAVDASAEEAARVLGIPTASSGHGATWHCAPPDLLQLGPEEYVPSDEDAYEGENGDSQYGEAGAAQRSTRRLQDALRLACSPVTFAAIGTKEAVADTDATGGQLQARSVLLSATILRMHAHAVDCGGGAADVFMSAPEDGAAFACTGEWLHSLHCAALLQAVIALPGSAANIMEGLVQAGRFGISSEAPPDMAGLFRVWLDVRLHEVDPDLAATTDLLATVFLVACGQLEDAFTLSRAAVTALAAATAAAAAPHAAAAADVAAATDTRKVLLVFAAELSIAVLAERWRPACDADTAAAHSATAEMLMLGGQVLETVAIGLQVAQATGEAPGEGTAAGEEAQAWGRCAWVRLAEHMFKSLRQCAAEPPADGGDAVAVQEAAAIRAGSQALSASSMYVVGQGTCAMLMARIFAGVADAASPEAAFSDPSVRCVVETVAVSNAGVREMLFGLTAHALPAVLPSLLQHWPHESGQ
eukprot:jgi/Ulvmu1/3606/UM017_0018.1